MTDQERKQHLALQRFAAQCRDGAAAALAGEYRDITDQKYLNAECGLSGCQWLTAQHQVDVYRAEMSKALARIGKIAALCKRYNHPGCEPGSHALANKILEIATNEGGEFN